MTLVWKNRREPRSLDALSPLEQAQLRVISKLYFGEERPPESLLPPPGEADDEGEVLHDLSVSALEEDGVHAYDAWSYMADSGTFFRAGTAEVVGEIIQCGFESHPETEAGAQLARAYRAQPER